MGLGETERAARKQRWNESLPTTREDLFFLDYAPVLIASALTGENVEQLFRLIADIRRAAQRRAWEPAC